MLNNSYMQLLQEESHYTNTRNCKERLRQRRIIIKMIKNKESYKETRNSLYNIKENDNNIDIDKEGNFPLMNQNNKASTSPWNNTWAKKIQIQEDIITEQRNRMDKLQDFLKKCINICSKPYNELDLLPIDLKAIAYNANQILWLEV